METLQGSWSDQRDKLFQVVLECETPSSLWFEMCRNVESVVECRDCESWGYCLCEHCDEEAHLWQPFHNRKSCTDGFLQSIAPNKSVGGGIAEILERGL